MGLLVKPRNSLLMARPSMRNQAAEVLIDGAIRLPSLSKAYVRVVCEIVKVPVEPMASTAYENPVIVAVPA